jgi:hypothetical protein
MVNSVCPFSIRCFAMFDLLVYYSWCRCMIFVSFYKIYSLLYPDNVTVFTCDFVRLVCKYSIGVNIICSVGRREFLLHPVSYTNTYNANQEVIK